MDISWVNIGEFLKAAVPAIAAVTSMATLLVVGTISHRQWRTAQDKLALDLFDRRLAVWNEMSAAIVDGFDQCFAAWTGGPTGGWANDPLDKTMTKAAWNKAHWLFGNEVIVKFAFVESKLGRLRQSLFDKWDLDDSPVAREDRYKAQKQPALTAFNELTKLVEPYMMMGHIAVNLPAKPFRWPWSRKPKP